MKLIFIPSWYPSETRPEEGTFFRRWAQALSQAGHEVICLVSLIHSLKDLPRALTRRPGNGIAISRRRGITEYRQESINRYPGRERSFFKYYSKRCNRLLERILDDSGPPDAAVIHSSIWAGGALAESLDSLRVPYIVFEHLKEFLEPGQFSSVQIESIKSTWTRAEKIIAISGAMERSFKSLDPEIAGKAIRIPNPVDPDFLAGGEFTAHRGFNFVTTALFREEKRIEHLIRAFHLLQQHHSESRLTIIGDGQEFRRTRALVSRLGLNHKITLAGYLDQKQIMETLYNSDCFVLPSRIESFGVAAVEALATGLPVLATRCGGPEDFINPKTGMLIPVSDDPQVLADAMGKIFQSIHTFNRNEIRSFARKHYSMESYVRRCEQVLSSIISP